jgi:hypothetical protein
MISISEVFIGIDEIFAGNKVAHIAFNSNVWNSWIINV